MNNNNNYNAKKSRVENKRASRDRNKRGPRKWRGDAAAGRPLWCYNHAEENVGVSRGKEWEKKGGQIGTRGRIKLTMRAAEASKMDPEKIQETIEDAAVHGSPVV